MSKKARILVADDSGIVRTVMQKILSIDHDFVGAASSGREAVSMAEDLMPDLVIMDVTMPNMDGIQATRQILERLPTTDVIILSAKTDHDSVRDGLEAGARDYLAKPPKAEEIRTVIERVLKQRGTRMQHQKDSEELPGRGIWSFVGALGAAGRTTFMLSLANELLTLGGKVIVVEGDLAFGDVGFYLDLGPAGGTVADALDEFETISAQLVKKTVRQHGSGIDVLAMPALAEPVVDRSPERLVDLVHFLGRTYDYILVDLPSGVPDRYLTILDDSRFILPVECGTPERLKNFRNMIRVLEFCGYDERTLCPVLTMTQEKYARKILQRFRMDVKAFLPRDTTGIEKATRSGMPVTRVAPRSSYAQAVRDFVGEVLGLPGRTSAPQRPSGFLARLGLSGTHPAQG